MTGCTACIQEDRWQILSVEQEEYAGGTAIKVDRRKDRRSVMLDMK
jgi:hypothetical protein